MLRLSCKGLDTGKTFIAFPRNADEAALNAVLRIASTVGKALHIHKDSDGYVDAVCLGALPGKEWWKGVPDGDIRLDIV